MKRCPKCSTEKSIEEFSRCKTRKDGRAVHCKSCSNEMNKAAYRKRPLHYREKRKQTVERHKNRYVEWKATQKCLFCGEKEPICLDLHHKDPAQKDFVISEMVTQRGWKSLMKEIEKCVVVCSNCHRKLHKGLLTLP